MVFPLKELTVFASSSILAVSSAFVKVLQGKTVATVPSKELFRTTTEQNTISGDFALVYFNNIYSLFTIVFTYYVLSLFIMGKFMYSRK